MTERAATTTERGTNEAVFTVPAGPAGPKWQFFAFNEDYTLYYATGPFGGAKTDALVTSAIKTCLDYPGAVVAICRADLAVLKRTTMTDFLKKCEELNIALGEDAISHNKKDSVVTFPERDGKTSKVFFFGLVSGDYERKLKSLQPFRVYVDEANEITERMMEMALTRCRAKVYHKDTGKLGKVQVKLAANDMGNNWLWRRFIGTEHPGDLMDKPWTERNVGIQTNKIWNPVHAIQGSTIELPNGYRAQIQRKLRTPTNEVIFEVEQGVRYPASQCKLILETAAVYIFTEENWSLNQQNIENFYFVSAGMRKQFLEGKVDTKSGLMFPMFSEATHVLPRAVAPVEWLRVVAVDHGLDHPTAAVVCALNPAGDLIVLEEYEHAGLAVAENAYNVKGLVDGRNVRWFGDPAMFRREPLNPTMTIAGVYQQAGCRPMRPADNRREFGITALQEFLTPKPYPGLKKPVPRLWVMEHCERTIERLHNHTWEEAKRKVHDDLVDALRYAVTGVYRGNTDTLDDEPEFSPAAWGRQGAA